jgi:hypothetical protein
MPTTNDPAATGSATIIVSESPVRAPLLDGIPWTPAGDFPPIGFAAQVGAVPQAAVDLHGGKMNRQR